MHVSDSATLSFTVTAADTAQALGSGDLPVLGTPRLLAWCEAVTCVVVDRSAGPGKTSVGTRVQLDHLVASPLGAVVEARAIVAYVDGRLVRFEVVAEHTTSAGDTAVVAHGEVTRVVVDRDRFLSRLGS